MFNYFQGPEDEVQLDKITSVDCLDDDPNYPYQFVVQFARKRFWKLKSNSEVMSTTYHTATVDYVVTMFNIAPKMF